MENENNPVENAASIKTPQIIPDTVTDILPVELPAVPEEKEDIKTWLMTALKPLETLATSLSQMVQSLAETQSQIVADLSTLKAPTRPIINGTNKEISNIVSAQASPLESADAVAQAATEVPLEAARKAREMFKL